MKTKLLFIIMLVASQMVNGQVRTPKLTVYKIYKPSVILLSDGRKLNEPLTNIFLKNSSLLYMSGTVSKEAKIDNIISVQFDDRLYLKIDSVLAYQVDTIGNDALFCATVIDQESYRQNLKNNMVISNLSFNTDQLGTTSVDLNTEDDHLFPLINIFYYRIDGTFVRCHERNLNRLLNKEKRRIMRSYMALPDFDWTDQKSLIKLLKGLQ